MSIRPIPKRLLIHSVDYREFIEDQRWGDGFADPVTLEFVRVEPATSMNRDTSKEEVVARSVLYIDRVHTKPFVQPKEKDRVVFQGKEYEVHKVDVHYAFGPRIHHLEVELV